jgi:hypothetical protein
VRFVLLEGTAASPTVVDRRTHTGSQEDLPLVLAEIMRDARTLLGEFSPDAVVIREPDRPPGPVNRVATRNAGLSDGILTALAREATPNTHLLSGRDIGRVCESNKAAVEEVGAALAGEEYGRACAAATAALVEARA